jgi:hypothetical protein
MWHVQFVVCIKEIGKYGLTTYLCVEESTCIVTREWGFKSIIGLHRKKRLNCFVVHSFLSNFQREKFEKMK